ncbi:MAG TPA: MBL fold metallo-hydrolase [Candidatus Dojkabacteria bacterium]|jgi:metallo-beta-lactamase family protein|nr:MBL fold metallo-hydrolase [Candidatus Dojkabacteria bacterium]
MTIQFLGAAKTVTGSCFYVKTDNTKFLVDCGAFQGPLELEKRNYEPFPFDPAELDYVFLTHAHYDHCGRLPMLVKQGFRGRIFCTQPTRDLARVILLDSASLQEEEYKRWSVKAKTDIDVRKPLFTEQDIEECMKYFEVYPYGTSVNVSQEVEFRMRDAGHILGSAVMEFWLKNGMGRLRKIVFSGDIGQPGARIVSDPDLVRDADYVICESTYGNRLHKDRNETVLELLGVLTRTQREGGNVLIPSFAIERTQELLYEMNLFIENKLISNLPIYLDSPMASKATEIFRQYPDFYDEDAKRLIQKGDDPFDFPGLTKIDSADESKRLISKKGVVIIAGSGMCTGGRILHHLKNNIENPSTHIVIVGYQVEGTLGRDLVNGEKVVKIMGQDYQNNAKISTLNGFSGHGDERDLRYWLRSFGHTPRQIFLVHGDPEIINDFAKDLSQEINNDIYIPEHLEEVKLD